MGRHYLTHFAQAYGSGTYSSCAYSEGGAATGACATSSAGPVTSPDGGGLLANTGIAIIFIVTVACLLIFAALVVRMWRRKPAGTAS